MEDGSRGVSPRRAFFSERAIKPPLACSVFTDTESLSPDLFGTLTHLPSCKVKEDGSAATRRGSVPSRDWDV